MNVVIWARVSSREQKEGYSLDAQLRTTRERATKNGWNVVREFVVAESAKRGAERIVFNEMFKWVKANAKRVKIQAILSHKLDRVCRNMRDAVRMQELEDTCGVQLAFVENQFGPGAAGALSFNVMAAVAQYYSDNLRTEVLKGMDGSVITIPELKKTLPRQVNHNTLRVILEYLERSNKIAVSLKGITWIQNTNKELRKAVKTGLEL